MFKALFRRQLIEMTASLHRSRLTGRQRTKGGMVVFCLLTALLVAVMLGSFALLAYPMCALLAPLDLGWLYFASMLLLALMLSVTGSVFVSQSQLFEASDNELLLALPIPPGTILGVRLLNIYLEAFLYLLLVLLPTEGAWLHYSGDPGPALWSAVPVALVLSGVSVVLSGLIGWVVTAVKGRVRHKSVVSSAVTIFLLALYLTGYQHVRDVLDVLYDAAVQAGAHPGQEAGLLYWFGGAACGNGTALALFAVGTAAVLAVFCAVLAHNYVRLMTARHAAPKAAYTGKPRRVFSVHAALLRRELQRFGASSPYLLNGVLSVLLLVLLGAVSLWKPAFVYELLAPLSEVLRIPALCAVVCAAAGTNPIAAPSVSLEGKTLWLLQSLPVEPWQALRAKLELHLLLGVLPALFSAAGMLAALGSASAPECAAVLAVVLAYELFAACMGLALGLRLPNLHWTSEAAVIKQSWASSLTLFGGWAAALAIALLYLPQADLLTPAQYLLLCAAVLFAAALVLYRWLRRLGTKIFASL